MRLTSTLIAVFAILVLTCLSSAAPPSPSATRSTDDAAELYRLAAEQITVSSPAESNLVYDDYPPFPIAWHQLSEKAWAKNRAMFELARQARSAKAANWPTGNDTKYVNPLRRVAIELSDGVLHEYLAGHHAAAAELARDELHLAALLSGNPGKNLIPLLVSVGVYCSASNRLMVLCAGIALTRDEDDKNALNVQAARQIIDELLDQRDPKQQLIEIWGPEGTDAWKDPTLNAEGVIKSVNRGNAERTYAAMSLSCHLFHFETGHWPQSLDDLVPKYLPRAPIDPWGDGKQTFGYVLIKHGLPDGSHRPLVYSRSESAGEMFYRLDAPQYGFYIRHTTDPKTGRNQRGDQFRDVARWVPVPRPAGSPDAASLP